MTCVLIVDDEELLARTIARYLDKRGHEVHYATNAAQAWQLFQAKRPDLCLIDYRLGRDDGVALVAKMKSARPRVDLIMMTGHGDLSVAIAAMKAGAKDFLVKPVPLVNLDALVGESGAELAQTPEHGQGVAALRGRSAAAIDMRASVTRIVDATRHLTEQLPPVLITGESGTGKDLVARAIHQDGCRATGPLVSVNCASLPAELVESELFGHVRGAFTDARSDKTGLIESAHGGILFLDEVGDMPLAAQAKLLRVLESRRVRRVGSVQDVPVDVWILAATNRSLSELVAAGDFRGDLMFRLQVLWIEVAPLRHRDSDVLLLANEFLGEFSRKYDSPAKGFAADARAVLIEHHWPGNVRELRNVIERATLLCRDPEIRAEHLRISVQSVAQEARVDQASTLAEVEVRLLRQALDRANGNVTRAAALLGISRDTLRYRVEKYGLNRSSS